MKKKVFEKRSGINIVLVMLYGFKIDLLLFVLCNVDLTYPPVLHSIQMIFP